MDEPEKVAHLQGAVSPVSRCAYREGKPLEMVCLNQELLVFLFYLKTLVLAWTFSLEKDRSMVDYKFTTVVSAKRQSNSG